jgi:hypothetical protein
MSVIKAIHKVYRAWTGGAQAHAEFARMLGEAAGHEGRRFLVPDADELDITLTLAKRFNDGIYAISNHSEDVRNTPTDQRIY